jgi:hypothetical protein
MNNIISKIITLLIITFTFLLNFTSTAQFSTKLSLTELKVNCPTNLFGTWVIDSKENDLKEKRFKNYLIIRKYGERGFTIQTFKDSESDDYNNYRSELLDAFLIKINDVYFLVFKKVTKNEEESDGENIDDVNLIGNYTIQRLNLKEDNFTLMDIVSIDKEFTTVKELEAFFKKNIDNSFFYDNNGYNFFKDKIMYKLL